MVLDVSPCDGAPRWQECVRQKERGFVQTVPGVERRGDQLVINPRAGTPVRLQDSVGAHGVGHHYVYSAFLPAIDAHLVEVQLYEGGGHLLVSRRTGRLTSLDAPPILAPDRSRFVTASYDTEAGYDPNRIQIRKLDADSAVLEWEMEPIMWGPTDPQWLDDSTLTIVRQPALGHPDSTQLARPLLLRRRAGAWLADSLSDAP